MRGALATKLAAALLPPALAIVVALVIGDLLILGFGQSPSHVYGLLLQGTWGNPYGLGQVLYKATTLTFTGLSVAFALRAGLFNIGAESQLAAGAFAAALVGLALPTSTPWVVAAIACVGAAAFAGGAVGGAAGVLRARFGAHEVIVTIMLNFVVLALINWAVATRVHEPETLHTPAIGAGAFARLSGLFPSLHGSAASWVIALAALAAVASFVTLFRSAFGYELRAVGAQPAAAAAGGISVGKVLTASMFLAGAVAGVGGTNFVLGYKGYYEDGMAGGAGFMGIAVAIVGRNHPLGVVLAALLFATLSQGGLAIHAAVPKQLVEVLQATVILVIAATTPEVRRVLIASARRAGRAVAGREAR